MKIRGRHPVIHVTRVTNGRCVAKFETDLLDAVFSVSFPETLTGAVALHRFAEMIGQQYGKEVELRIDEPFPLQNKAVTDVLRSIEEGVPVAG